MGKHNRGHSTSKFTQITTLVGGAHTHMGLETDGRAHTPRDTHIIITTHQVTIKTANRQTASQSSL